MFKHALIVGKFAPFHKGHQLLVETAISECLKVTVLVYSNPDFEGMNQNIRAEWIRKLYPSVNVMTPADVPNNQDDDFTQRVFVKQFLIANDIVIDSVFTSENYGLGFADHLGVKHRLFDLSRKRIPVSGTKLRANIHLNKEFLSPIVYSHFVKKIVFMGAESTGKSTLTRSVASHFKTKFMVEYGRQYYEEKQRNLDLDDYLVIAQRHRAMEDELALTSTQFLFVDTNAITTLFYSYYYNAGGVPALHALATLCSTRYDRFYLCADDIPFEQDGSRDTPELRTKMQRMIMMDLVSRGVSFKILYGDLNQRIKTVYEDLLR